MRTHLGTLAAVAVLALTCSNPQNPFDDVGNAGIVEHNLPQDDTLAVSSVYQCSVRVRLPEYIDSYYVYVNIEGSDSVVVSDTVGSPNIYFSFSVPDTGLLTVDIVLVRTDGSRDTLSMSYVGIVAASSSFLVDDSFRPFGAGRLSPPSGQLCRGAERR
jgi:hypothetical protein